MLKIKNKYVVYLVFIFIILGSLLIAIYSFSLKFEGLDISETQIISKNSDGSYTIPNGYYVITDDSDNDLKNTKTIAKIPYGYILDSDGILVPNTNVGIYSTTQQSNNDELSKYTITDSSSKNPYRYDSNNYNMTYHSDPTLNSDANEMSDNLAKTGTWVIDRNGKKTLIPWSEIKKDITYYTPGSYPFGPSNYVPNYENSIYLSQTTGISQASPLINTAAMKLGFCSQNANYPNILEQNCNSLDVNTCGSTSCCVLLGGSKCVAGNSKGPTINANYSDIFIKNKDVYYYRGKCYGNCN